MTVAPRTLPIVIPPVTYETVDSYLKRLAAVNHIATEDIEIAVGASKSYYASRWRPRTLDASKLAAVTGQSLNRLTHALPELQQPALTLKRFQARTRAACPHCVRRHAGQHIIRFYPHHVNACVRHDLWLGSLAPASRAWPSEYDTIDISDVPEIKNAQVQHRRLVKRHGPYPVLAATCAAWKVKDHMHGNQLAQEQEIRLKKLRPEKERFHGDDPALHAASYPEVIAAASLLVTPRWQDDVNNPHRRTKAYAALGRRLGWSLHTDWDPSHRNPLHEWIDPDDRQSRLRSDKPDFAPIRYGGPDAGWTTRCI